MEQERAAVVRQVQSLVERKDFKVGFVAERLGIILPDIKQRGVETLAVDKDAMAVLFLTYFRNDPRIRFICQPTENNSDRNKAERMALDSFWRSNVGTFQDFISCRFGLQIISSSDLFLGKVF